MRKHGVSSLRLITWYAAFTVADGLKCENVACVLRVSDLDGVARSPQHDRRSHRHLDDAAVPSGGSGHSPPG